MENKDIIVELLTEGICDTKNKIYNIHEINSYLREMCFEAIEWYDNSSIILKDLNPSEEVILPWKKNLMSDVNNIVNKIATKDSENLNGEGLQLLLKHKWIEKCNNEYVLSKRFLIQHSDYLEETCERFKKCSLCGILVSDGSVTHEYCNNLASL